MTTNEMAPPVEDVASPEGDPNSADALQWEASRLREFKKEKVKKNNQTPCPACATYVHINASKCPHCTSDIAANNALVRESLRRLEEITAQLEAMREQHIERIHGVPRRPFRERFKGFFSDPQTRAEMKIVAPTLLLFFAAVTAFRILGNQALFWSFSIAGGVITYLAFSKRGIKRLVTIDLYRSVLVFGLLAVMANAVALPASWRSDGNGRSARVLGSTVNIRTSHTTQSAVLATAHHGDRLTIVERRGDWVRIQTKDGQEGWVYASLLE